MVYFFFCVVIWMKGLRDITCGPRSYKEGHDDYVRLTLKRACPSDEGTYCILLKNRYGCDRSFFTVQVIIIFFFAHKYNEPSNYSAA